MKRFILILLILLTGKAIEAQTDSIIDAYNKSFEEFRMSADKEFDAYQSQTDSIFLKFLEQTWTEFEVFQQTQHLHPKPKDQPLIKVKTDTSLQRIEYEAPIKTEGVPVDKHPSEPELKISKPANLESRAISKSFNIFGNTAQVYYYPDKLPRLNAINEESITAFYKDLTNYNLIWKYNISEFNKIKRLSHFNDWGYYQTIKKAAETIFTSKKEQTLFIWFALSKSGYKVKVGFSNSSIYLLLPSQQELFGIQYLSESSLKYYLFQGIQDQPVQLKTYQGYYTEDAKIFSFELNELPKLNNGKSEFRQFSYNQVDINFKFNQAIIAFLDSYPQCDLQTYFELPISYSTNDALDELFVPMFQGKTDREKVDILLNFIQKSVAYKIDQKQFGKERYMFAEECLYYPYSDCEDRSVLLGQLVKHYTGLSAIGLEFLDHVTLAVHFPEEEYGNYVMFLERKYFICDPTYINAKSGMIPEYLKDEKPKIIVCGSKN